MKGEIMFISLDVGGSNILGARYDDNGKKLDQHKVKTKAHQGKDAVIKRILSTIEELKGEHPIKGICIAIPGIIKDDSIVVFCPNIDFVNLDLKKIVQEIYDVPVLIVNDVNAAMWGEWRTIGKKLNNGVGLFLGTGVGGSIIIDDKLYTGKGGAAEIGHMNMVHDGFACGCGQRGCLEAYASKSGIMRVLEMEKQNNRESMLLEVFNKKGKMISSSALRRAFHKDDELAVELINRLTHYVGLAIGTLHAIFEPDVFIIGGGIAESFGNEILKPIDEVARKNTMPQLAHNLNIQLSKLEDDAGIYGAYCLIRESL